MHEIIDVEKLIKITDEVEWKKTYEEELCKLGKFSKEINQLSYQMYASSEQDPKLQEMTEVRQRLLTYPNFKAMLEEWATKIEDKQWKKRIHLMLQEIQNQEIEADTVVLTLKNQLEGKIFSKTFDVDGKTYNSGQVHSALMDHEDRSVRRRLVEAMNSYSNELTEDFRNLLKLRNQKAREYGYTNYHHYKFSSANLSFEQYKEECLRMFSNCKPVINEWVNRIKERFGYETLHVYDLLFVATNFSDVDQSIFSGEKIKVAIEEALSYFGLDLKNSPIDVELLHIPYGGFCIEISPEYIKLVINNRNSHLAYATGFHELGHALYNQFASTDIYEFKQFQSNIGHEGMAELFMTIPYQSEWLSDYYKLDPKMVEQLVESKHLADIFISLFYFYISLLEYELYQNPDCDMDEVSNKLLKDVFDIEGPSQHPATQVMLISYPIYVQDYIYADGIRDMLRYHFQIDGMYKEKDVFKEIKNTFMEPTERLTWQERVKSLCGEEFTFTYFEDYLVNKKTTKMK